MSEPVKKETRGRKPRNYDRSIFEGLCAIHCTVDEIEGVFHTDQRSIDRWCQREYGCSFQDIYQEYKKGGKASLRRYQMNLAKKNAAVSIWLGKQMLGQRDIPMEYEQFNGKLSLLLDTLKTIRSETEMKDNKMKKLEEVVAKEEKEEKEYQEEEDGLDTHAE